MEPGDLMPHLQGSSIIPILSRVNLTPRIDTYFFKIHSNIVLPLTPSLLKGPLPVGLAVKALIPSSIMTT